MWFVCLFPGKLDLKVLQVIDCVFSFLLHCFTVVKVHCCGELTLSPPSFAK